MIALSGQFFLIHIFCFLLFFFTYCRVSSMFPGLIFLSPEIHLLNFFFHKALPETNLAHFLLPYLKVFILMEGVKKAA